MTSLAGLKYWRQRWNKGGKLHESTFWNIYQKDKITQYGETCTVCVCARAGLKSASAFSEMFGEGFSEYVAFKSKGHIILECPQLWCMY